MVAEWVATNHGFYLAAGYSLQFFYGQRRISDEQPWVVPELEAQLVPRFRWNGKLHV